MRKAIHPWNWKNEAFLFLFSIQYYAPDLASVSIMQQSLYGGPIETGLALNKSALGE